MSDLPLKNTSSIVIDDPGTTANNSGICACAVVAFCSGLAPVSLIRPSCMPACLHDCMKQ